MTSPIPVRRLRAWAVGLVVLWSAGEASAHIPAEVELSVKVEDDAARLHLRVLDRLFETWFGVDPAAAQSPANGGGGDARRTVEERVDRWARVAIDRVPVRGVLEGVERKTWSDHGLTRTYVVVTVAYGAKGAPREVAIAWTHWEGTVEDLDVEVDGFGETTYYVLAAREPELVWHRPRAKVVREVPVPLPAEGRREVAVSLPALLAALLLVAGAALSVRVRALRRPVLGLVLAGAAAAFAVGNVLPVRLPFLGAAPLERPGAEEAKALFESLLRNVYRAFDYDREDAIYDTLAHTVSGPLLDRVYEEVYTSLVMKEQGGAVSRVEKVEVVEQEVLAQAGPTEASFRVRCLWRVHGKVGHWGHTHQRINEHEAVFTVAPEGGRWKIVDVKVVSQKRVDAEPGR